MAVNLNSTILSQLPPELAGAQRALFYADGLFETIRVFEGRIPFLDKHLQRLFAGLTALGFDLPDEWNARFFHEEITKIAPPNARVRLAVWRSAGGLYFPENNTPQFLITANALENAHFQWLEEGVSLGVCESVRLPVDSFSNFKTLNAARYVVAAREARMQGWDEGLLLNSAGRIAEATSSNVFWWEGEKLCTPPLAEGCVAGILRATLLELAAAQNTDFFEKPLLPDAVSHADEIFLSNAVRGIVPVRIFAGRQFGHSRSKELFRKLLAEIDRI